ncbi:MAG TPA: hypothetical protein VN328_07875 [Thermodesulfovibrionales bacterium]|nr:hypothetical protein [Thermodesulfovibrionales bacterium]
MTIEKSSWKAMSSKVIPKDGSPLSKQCQFSFKDNVSGTFGKKYGLKVGYIAGFRNMAGLEERSDEHVSGVTVDKTDNEGPLQGLLWPIISILGVGLLCLLVPVIIGFGIFSLLKYMLLKVFSLKSNIVTILIAIVIPYIIFFARARVIEKRKKRRKADSEKEVEQIQRKEKKCRESGDKADLRKLLQRKGLALRRLSRLEEEMEVQKEVETICRQIDNKDNLQRSLCNQAFILLQWGKYDEAVRCLEEQERICLEIGNKKDLGLGYYYGACVRAEEGKIFRFRDSLSRRCKEQEALDYLVKAVECGFDYAYLAEKEMHLELLWGLPGFGDILKRMEDNKVAHDKGK